MPRPFAIRGAGALSGQPGPDRRGKSASGEGPETLSRFRAAPRAGAALLAALGFAVCLGLGLAVPLRAAEAPAAAPAPSEETWGSIKDDIFRSGEIGPAEGIVALQAPIRAEDAALVPLSIALALPEGDPRTLKAVTLVIDENPAPMAGRFTFGPDTRDFTLQLRVRVNSYSYVRAVAELSDGGLHMAKAFVKASGGCSAPATKDTAESITHLGEMRFRAFTDQGRNEAQIQIRHPNFSGLQRDEATLGYKPAWFVREIKVMQGDRPLFSLVEGGISISEDPTFRFSYRANGQPVSVEAEDTEGTRFKANFPGGGS